MWSSEASTVGLSAAASCSSQVSGELGGLPLPLTRVSPAPGTWHICCHALSIWKEMDPTSRKVSAICPKLHGLEMAEQEPHSSLPASEALTLACPYMWVAQLLGQAGWCLCHTLDPWDLCSQGLLLSALDLSFPPRHLPDSTSPH